MERTRQSPAFIGRWILEEVLEGERTDRPGAVHGVVRKAKQKLHNPTQLALMGVKEATGQFLGPASMGITVGQMALKDGGAPGRTAAVAALAKDPDPYVVTLLEWALADKSWAVRAAVVKALGERGNWAVDCAVTLSLQRSCDDARQGYAGAGDAAGNPSKGCGQHLGPHDESESRSKALRPV